MKEMSNYQPTRRALKWQGKECTDGGGKLSGQNQEKPIDEIIMDKPQMTVQEHQVVLISFKLMLKGGGSE